MYTRRRRDSFDEMAELYNAARPPYPPELIADLVALSGVGEGARVLEIGPGTGQLTVPLAARGLAVTAVERGPNLALLARENLARFPQAEVLVADFDVWEPPAEPFDMVVAAAAFHWLDPATRLERCAAALRPGGALAIVGIRWGVNTGDDRFFRESQQCWARWDPAYDPAFRQPALADLPAEHPELAASPLFALTGYRRCLSERTYSAKGYCDLLGTYSNIQVMEEQSRAGFLSCIAGLIESRFGGRVVRHDVYDLWVARRRAGGGS
jgi:SAM-dependent methyltransferase